MKPCIFLGSGDLPEDLNDLDQALLALRDRVLAQEQVTLAAVREAARAR